MNLLIELIMIFIDMFVSGPVPLGLAYVLLVETNPFPNLSLFYRTMLFENPSVRSRFCFLCPFDYTSFMQMGRFAFENLLTTDV